MVFPLFYYSISGFVVRNVGENHENVFYMAYWRHLGLIKWYNVWYGKFIWEYLALFGKYF